MPLPVRRAPARARRRGCCSTRAMAPHGRAARRVAGPVTERRRNPVNVRVCNVGGLRWPLIAFASYQPTDCRPLATYRRHSLAVAVLHSTPPHPTCLSHPSLSALGLIQSIPHSSGATGVPGEASRGSLYESVCQVTIYVHRAPVACACPRPPPGLLQRAHDGATRQGNRARSRAGRGEVRTTR